MTSRGPRPRDPGRHPFRGLGASMSTLPAVGYLLISLRSCPPPLRLQVPLRRPIAEHPPPACPGHPHGPTSPPPPRTKARKHSIQDKDKTNKQSPGRPPRAPSGTTTPSPDSRQTPPEVSCLRHNPHSLRPQTLRTTPAPNPQTIPHPGPTPQTLTSETCQYTHKRPSPPPNPHPSPSRVAGPHLRTAARMRRLASRRPVGG